MQPRSLTSFDATCIDQKVIEALAKLDRKDRYLFENDVNERSICFRLGLYLQTEFPDFEVDCEYNRDHKDPYIGKRLHDEELVKLRAQLKHVVNKQGTDYVTVYPDIIVHRRGTDENLLVIESKKCNSNVPDVYDERKLIVYQSALKYRFAKFIKFRVFPAENENVIVLNRSVVMQ